MGIYQDNGKENGNYGVYSGYIRDILGKWKKKTETVGVILGLYWVSFRILETKMETTIQGGSYSIPSPVRAQGLGFRGRSTAK